MSEPRPVVEEFRLKNPAEEFEVYSKAEIERLQNTQEHFQPDLYQKAVQLVLRRLGRDEEM